jgi:SOS response associated peptidase (SRAP)
MRWLRPAARRPKVLAPPPIGAAMIHPMCGRYASFLPAEAIARIFGTVKPAAEPRAVLERRADAGGGSCPPQPGPGGRHLDLLKWALLPHWTKEPTTAQRPINARSETAAKSGISAAGRRSRNGCWPAPTR